MEWVEGLQIGVKNEMGVHFLSENFNENLGAN